MSGAILDATEHGLDAEVADFVIVGSGAGGGAAARILARSGASVVVLEEGPYFPRGHPTPAVREALPALFRNHGRFAAFGHATTPILQGCAVGGTTLVNSAIIWRLPDHVLATWHKDHGLAEALPAAELESAYQLLEDELSVRPVAEGLTSNAQDLLLRTGAERAGIAGRFIHRNEKGCQGSARCVFGCPNSAKQSTAINSLKRAVDDGAHVFAHARVDRVLFEGARAVAVTGAIGGRGPSAGRRFRIAARKAVIIAASAVQSPNLLRRSGVKSAALGERFMSHPGTPVMGVYPQVVNMWRGASQGYEAIGLRDTLGVKVESLNVPPEVVSSRLPGAGAKLASYLEKLPHLTTWSIAVKAEAQGRVRPSWLFGDKVTYDLTRNDVDRVRQGMKRIAEMHFLAGAKEVITGVHGMPEVLTSADQLKAYDSAPVDARAYTLLATHLFGGCCAGPDPSRSVVDPTLKVHGREGLYVMDASVFPSNTGVNPQHSIMAWVTVAARRLAAA